MNDHPPVAIVGIGGIFPGSPDLETFWQNVAAGVDTSREAPPGRWALPPEMAYDSRGGQVDKLYSKRACFIEDFDLDLSGLAIDRHDAERFDPMVQLALHAGSAAWRDAIMDDVDRDRIGVILGNIALPTESTSRMADWIIGRNYTNALFEAAGKTPPVDDWRPVDHINRYVTGLPAGVLSRALGLGRGHFTLDAACASSLYALKHAVDELQAGRADAMLTGGLSRPDCLYTQMGFAQLFALSPSGHCSPFDAKADGLVVGEGAGIIVLKRLDDAVAAGDRIYAVVRGIGLSNDVDGNLLAPSEEGQLRAMHAAYGRAGWEPSQVDLIECHATGTQVGDAIEYGSLRRLWGESNWQHGQCTLGSVKSNVGHLLTGAGAAGLIKVLLAMREGVLPPTANFTGAGDDIDLASGPFTVRSEASPWPRRGGDTPRRAAVSGFGFGGTNAHVLLEEFTQPAVRPVVSKQGPTEDVVIVGMGACCGPWTDLEALRPRVLGDDVEVKTSAKQNFWGVEDPPLGWFVDRVEIPRGRFRIPPKEMAQTLPQQLLMLDVAHQALADQVSASTDPLRTGVFIGIGLDLNTTNYHLRWSMRRRSANVAAALGIPDRGPEFDAWADSACDGLGPALNANRVMGNLGGIVASRVAREFGIGGPSYVLSTEESSGLTALEAATRNLQSGDLDCALVGAVDLAADVRAVLATDADRPFDRDGIPRPFDRRAAGSVPGEGAACVILKRRRDAERDGDRIYAVVRGIGASTGGEATDFAPTTTAYREALSRAYNEAGIDPRTVDYVETHGSGVPAEDRIEAATIPQFFGPCTLGSAKADVGHTGSAAGLVSLVKASLALHHGILPRMRGVTRPRKDLGDCLVPAEPQYWLRDSDASPRRAGVSSISVTGASHHVVLETGDSAEEPHPLGMLGEYLFAVEASDSPDLVTGLGDLVSRTTDADVARLAWEWQQERAQSSSANLAVAIVCRSTDELRELATEAIASLTEDRELSARASRRVFHAQQPVGHDGEIAFVYPGSGSQFIGMGRAIGAHWPTVLRDQERLCTRLRSQLAPDLIWSGDSATLRDEARRSILAQVSLGTVVTDVVRSFGVQPHAVIGYSLGETAGLFSVGAWHERDEMLRRVMDSDLFTEQLTGSCRAAKRTWRLPDDENVDWVLGVVDRPAAIVRATLVDHPRAYLLIVNSPDECVVGGQREAVDAVVSAMASGFHELHGVTTVHCDVAEAVAGEYRDLHILQTDTSVPVRFYSGEAGTSYELSQHAAADSILNQALRGIDYPKVIERAYADGVRIFVEMGPGSSCTRMIRKILGDRPFAARAVCAPGQDGPSSVLRTLAMLIAERAPVDISSLYHEPKTEDDGGDSIIVEVGGQAPVPPVLPQTIPDASPPPPPEPGPVHALTGPVEQLARANAAAAAAHESFLQLSHQLTTLAAQTVSLPAIGSVDPVPVIVPKKPVLFDRGQCMEIAVGSIAAVLGPEFADVDMHPTRVRLPDEPLMLVDRILSIEGDVRSMTSGRIVTEHDVLADKWYLDNGRIPTCVAVEAGQADLFLSGYLGIDFETKGLAVYRLLDAVVTFHDALPGVGTVIHYEIQIKHFFRQGDTWLFRFEFEAEVDGRPLITMKEGCAGFFTQEELDAGKGIVHSRIERQRQPGRLPDNHVDLVPMRPTALDATQIDALRRGDLERAFGPEFEGLPVADPLTLPSGNMELVHRVRSIDPTGGRYGIGGIVAEADIRPDDWFLTCHFVDDKVMPGTLMYECCLHTLRIYLLRLGWVADAADVVYQPLIGVGSRLKCRGQVLDTTKLVTYEVSIKQLGYEPEPFAIVDALMYADGKPVVEITEMSVRLTGVTRDVLIATWANRGTASTARVLYDYDKILAFSDGNPSDAFGEPYRVFDHERVIARLPRPPFQFLDRIIDVQGTPFEMTAGAKCTAQVEVTADQWYFASNRQHEIPFAVLLEMALQPCGWLAAYVGSALSSDEDLKFRNLGGESTQHAAVVAGDDTLTTHVELTQVAHSGGMVIQHYRYEMTNRAGAVVYDGTTYFGFFSYRALAEQIGVREATLYEPSAGETARGRALEVPRLAPFSDDTMRMVDRIDSLILDGGPKNLGFVTGSIEVDPSMWFFAAHFHQDPVWPGSLGLEAMLQLLKVVAVSRWDLGPDAVFATMPIGHRHRWIYRGQVIPTNTLVEVQATVTSVDDERQTLIADGFLCVDGLTIYEMRDFALSARPSQ